MEVTKPKISGCFEIPGFLMTKKAEVAAEKLHLIIENVGLWRKFVAAIGTA